MRKWILALLALVMLLTAACSAKTDQKDEAAPPQSQQTAGVQPEVPADTAKPDVSAPEPDGLLPDPDKGDGNVMDDEGETDGYVIRISHTDVTLKSEGETFRLTVWDSNGKEPDAWTYASADPAVAAVDEAGGEVTAVAPGTTTITVHAEFGEIRQDMECIVRCGWEEAEPSLPVSGDTERQTLDGFFASIQGSYEGLNAMMVMEGELLDNYYPGLSGMSCVEEVLVQETMISISNVAVGLVKLSDSATQDDIVAVQDIFQKRIDAQADGGAWYPASCETWGSGVITSTSNAVGMFVHPDGAQAMADQFTAAFAG